MFPVFINRIGVDKNVININNGEMAERIKNNIHNVLELTKGILRTKRHNIPLIMSKRSGKSNFILITFTNLDLLEPRFHVKLGKYYNLTQSLNQIIFIRYGIPNSFQDLVQGFIINN